MTLGELVIITITLFYIGWSYYEIRQLATQQEHWSDRVSSALWVVLTALSLFFLFCYLLIQVAVHWNCVII